MNFFDRTTTWTNIQLWSFKVCVFLFGLAGGTWLGNILRPALPVILTLAVAGGVWMAVLWIKKLKGGH